jgi:hypothetical protein
MEIAVQYSQNALPLKINVDTKAAVSLFISRQAEIGNSADNAFGFRSQKGIVS